MSLAVKNITLCLGNKNILKDITFNIDQRELVVVLGLNGVGKTTLMKSIVGIINPLLGSIYIDENDIRKISMKKRSTLISYVPQNADIDLDYSIFDFVLMGITPHLSVFDMPSQVHYKKAEDALEFINLIHLKDKNMNEISGGERQLAFLARAFVQGSRMMVLDEPNAHLDYKAQHLFLTKLRNFIKDTNKSALITLHDPNLALRYADKILLIHNHEIIETVNSSCFEELKPFMDTLNEIYENRLKFIQNEGTCLIGWSSWDIV